MPVTYLFYAFYAVILIVPLAIYVRWQARKDKIARATADRGKASGGPRAQHPHIDTSHCIGCQGCTSVCPEGDVLGMVGGKAAVVNPFRCIGHGMCSEACPVGAISMVLASPSVSADLPFLTSEYETSVTNLFIAGELGGLALIRNAVSQGRDCIDTLAQRFANAPRIPGVSDVVIVGAGPAGISASLRAIEHRLHYVTLEREQIGGAVSKYPRQKLVMTSPLEFPLYGPMKKTELSKENLLSFWKTIGERADFRVQENEPVEDIRRSPDGIFLLTTPHHQYHARAVILALGRSGPPRKLGVRGEDLPKVMYRLLEADHYVNRKILIVGGGDSAVEAALGLARQKGNAVTLCYRQASFTRIKERNAQRLRDAMRAGKVDVIYESVPIEIREDSVLLDVRGDTRALANDFVWIFAGGVAPNDFLKKIGIQFGARDLTAEASQEARELALK